MRRRDFIVFLGGAGTMPMLHFLAATAQPLPAKLWRIGFIVGGKASPAESPYNGFAQGMRERGYTEGKDFVIEWRSAEGRYDRLFGAAQELVRHNVDVIVLSTMAAIRPVQQVMQTVPIVIAYSTDPVGIGFVDSLSNPGGNVTGLAGSADQISPKQIELMRQVLPNLSCIGALGNPDNPNYEPILRSTEIAARTVGIGVFPIPVSSRDELEIAFAKFAETRCQAVRVFPDGLFFSQRSHVADLALRYRLPSISVQCECAEVGGLMSYGESLSDLFRRAASFVDKILKGAQPRDLPIEQSTKFELVVNLRTARLLGIDMPPTLVALADQLIE
jgi:putative tryptophan/tyrosine transport system substrate-binding protein